MPAVIEFLSTEPALDVMYLSLWCASLGVLNALYEGNIWLRIYIFWHIVGGFIDIGAIIYMYPGENELSKVRRGVTSWNSLKVERVQLYHVTLQKCISTVHFWTNLPWVLKKVTESGEMTEIVNENFSRDVICTCGKKMIQVISKLMLVKIAWHFSPFTWYSGTMVTFDENTWP